MNSRSEPYRDSRARPTRAQALGLLVWLLMFTLYVLIRLRG